MFKGISHTINIGGAQWLVKAKKHQEKQNAVVLAAEEMPNVAENNRNITQ